MRRALILAVSLLATACGGGGSSSSAAHADTTVRPGGTGWFCHGEQNAAFCARTMEECEALRTSQSASDTPTECTAHAQAHCYTFQHPTVGTHYRCYDSQTHCESARGHCTSDETCSACDAWD